THSSLRSRAFNWRVALDYKLTRDILAYGSIATGFKSGGFNGSFLSTIKSEIELQLKPIKPEHVTSYEIGLKSNFFENRLIFNAALFYNDYSDMQVFVLVPPPPGDVSDFPVNVLQNARRAHTEGIEAQIMAKPVQPLTISAQLGWLNTRLDEYV